MIDSFKKSYLATVIGWALMCLAVGTAMGGTVKIQTSTGAGACATYYTESGDWATGDATVSSAGSVDLETEGSVRMGLVRGGSSPGSGGFAPFTGDFSANASSSGGASATSTNPRVDIFVVSPPGGGTIGGFPTYSSISNAVGAANGGGDGANPDWLLVDEGTYNEQVAINGFEQDSALTSVWGADDTTINGAGGGRAVDINGSPSFLMEGLSVTGATGSNAHGIHVRGGSTGAQITCNTVTNNADAGIRVDDSTGVGIRKNTVSGSGGTGIRVRANSDNAQIEDNEVTGSTHHGISVRGNDNVTITGNTTSDNRRNGIRLQNSDDARIMNNIVTNNNVSGGADYRGISVEDDSDNVQITGNAVTGTTGDGIHVQDDPGSENDNAQIRSNIVAGNTGHGISVDRSNNAQITGNEVTESGDNGIRVNRSDDAVVSGNEAIDNRGHGIRVGNSDGVEISDNTAAENDQDGIILRDADDAVISGNSATDNGSDGIRIGNSRDGGDADAIGVVIHNNTAANNDRNGIKVTNNSDDVRITSNIITGNGEPGTDSGGVYLEDGCERAEINGNNIQGNQDFGLWNDTTDDVNATGNWWSRAAGPTYQGNLGVGNAGTSGRDIWDAADGPQDATGNGVDFQPFATTPFPLPLP